MARFLRVEPIEWHGDIALRVEIYGCMRGELFILSYFLWSAVGEFVALTICIPTPRIYRIRSLHGVIK